MYVQHRLMYALLNDFIKCLQLKKIWRNPNDIFNTACYLIINCANPQPNQLDLYAVQ